MENYNQSFGQEVTAEKSVLNPLEVDQAGKMNLAETAQWAKFLGILGLVLLVLMFLGGIVVMVIGSALFESAPELQSMPFSFGMLGIIYVIMAAIYIYPTWALIKFGSLIRAGIQAEDQAKFGEGLLYLKRFFKFIGLFTIVIIAIYILIIVAVSVGAGIGGLGN